MKVLLAIAFLATASALPVFESSTSIVAHEVDAAYVEPFNQFVAQYGKQYQSAQEKASRSKVFADNLNFINSWNAQNRSTTGVTVAMNEFGDLTHAEFKSFYLGYRPDLSKKARAAEFVFDIETYRLSAANIVFEIATSQSSSPSSAAKTHYGNPANGCMSDEQPVRIQGISGDFCSPDCTSAACPTDEPSGATAQPQCALKSSTGDDRACARKHVRTQTHKRARARLRAGSDRTHALICTRTHTRTHTWCRFGQEVRADLLAVDEVGRPPCGRRAMRCVCARVCLRVRATRNAAC